MLKARSFRTAMPVLFGTWVAVWMLTRAPMPFITVTFLAPGLKIPSGFILTGMFPVSSTLLFRDVASPVTLATSRPPWHERIVLLAVAVVVVTVGVAGVVVRLWFWDAPLVIGNALGLFGLTLIAAAILGAMRGATCVVAVIVADFVMAIAGVNANFNPTNSAMLLVIGTGLFVIGIALALIRGLDPGRSQRGEMTGVNEL